MLLPTHATKALPRHIAIIMDGNGRWAQHRQLPRLVGHQAGLRAVRRIIEACVASSIEVLTLFAFSSENWQRPNQEVEGLLSLFLEALQNELDSLIQQNIQLRIMGHTTQFSLDLQQEIKRAQQRTATNTGLILVIAAAYGGQWDITQAAQKMAAQVLAGCLQLDDITPLQMASYLQLSDLPDPDLCIRTGGECRLSNFLLWQLAYSELYFTSVLWPDFDKPDLEQALDFYVARERRFGTIHE